MKTGNKASTAIRLTVIYIILAIIAICAIYPALWVLMSSLRPGTSLAGSSLIPDQITIGHYIELFTNQSFQYGMWYINTLKCNLNHDFLHPADHT